MTILTKLNMTLENLNMCLGTSFEDSDAVDSWYSTLELECSQRCVEEHRQRTLDTLISWQEEAKHA